MKIDYASLLNEAQLEAVTTSSQHVRIIAGAGSGKTRVLTYRIAYLIDQWGADPYSILAVTFTNKAANEMKERVEKLIPGSSASLTVSTFQSFCARFLRNESHVLGYPSSFTILDDEDSDKMIVDVLVEMGYKKKDPFVKSVKNYIGRKKTLGIYPDDIKLVRETFHDEKKAIEAYREYETKKYQMFAFDFDDLLLKTLQILEEYPEIREKWSNRFSYLLVDEFQDTNNVQYRLLKDLCTMNTNVYVVGDPDQTIYTWRGANQGIILDFPREFPDYTDIVLDRNYRSTESILKAANKLIAHNKKRVPKNLYTEDEEGEPIITKSFESAEGEAKWIAKKVSELVREGSSYSDIAILYRAAYLTRSIESALAANRIPYRIFGGLRFYQRKEVKDVLAYFRLLLNEKDDVAFDRIVNVPRRGIGENSQGIIKTEAAALNLSEYEYVRVLSEHTETELSSKVINSLNVLSSYMENAKKKLLDNLEVYSKVLKDFITDIGYYKFIAEDQAIDEDRAENVNALFDDLNRFVSDNPESGFEEYLQNISLLTSQDDMNGGNYVSLMTVHVAKGLEFENVFIVSMNEGVFPSAKAEAEGEERDGPEEERRLAYVAMTRAKKLLVMTTNSGYSYVTDSHAVPSKFFEEAGVKVASSSGPYYGQGRGGYSSYGSSYGGSGGFYGGRSSSRPRVTRNEFGDDMEDDDFFGEFNVSKKKEPVIENKPKTNGVTEWKVGDRVTHATFGEGEVVQLIDKMIIVVEFKSAGKKTLLGTHPSLQKISSKGGIA